MANDFFSTLRTYLNKVKEGETTPTEVASAFNAWLRESGGALKLKIQEEVETSVSNMGFVKREEFDELRAEIVALSEKIDGARAKPSAKKATVKKATVKKSVKDK